MPFFTVRVIRVELGFRKGKGEERNAEERTPFILSFSGWRGGRGGKKRLVSLPHGIQQQQQQNNHNNQQFYT